MVKSRFLLFGALLMQMLYQAHSMKCQMLLGLDLECPTMFNDNDKAFCCRSSGNVPYCCDIGDYIQNNSAVIAGILVGGLIFLVVVTLCCCCFCSCCLLAKRRTQGHQLVPNTAPPMVYNASPYYPQQPTMMVHAPPPPLPPAYGDFQPPVNPNYKG